MKKNILKCPNCGKIINDFNDNKWRPFCSERCRLIDLGEWLDGDKRITAEINPDNYLSEDDNSIH